jgi:hypothetical protein
MAQTQSAGASSAARRPGKRLHSYMREDADAARRLSPALGDIGGDVWLDERRLQPGGRWEEEILGSIRREVRLFLPGEPPHPAFGHLLPHKSAGEKALDWRATHKSEMQGRRVVLRFCSSATRGVSCRNTPIARPRDRETSATQRLSNPATQQPNHEPKNATAFSASTGGEKKKSCACSMPRWRMRPTWSALSRPSTVRPAGEDGGVPSYYL